MVTLEPFAIEHLDLVEPDARQAIVLNREKGPTFTMFYDDDLIFCGGIVRSWPGNAEGWLYVTQAVKRCRVSFHKTVRAWIKRLCAQEGLRRLQVTVPAWNEASCRWIRLLGFEEEGLMRKYGPDGSDCLRFALFPGGEGET